MEKAKLFASTILTLILIMPLASAIFVGEATSEPTRITLTIGESKDDEQKPEIRVDRFSQIEAQKQADETIEEELRQVTYSDWNCVNGRLQRTIISLGHTEYEYGQACGQEISNEPEVNVTKLFLALNILLIVFIILSLILIATIALNKH